MIIGIIGAICFIIAALAYIIAMVIEKPDKPSGICWDKVFYICLILGTVLTIFDPYGAGLAWGLLKRTVMKTTGESKSNYSCLSKSKGRLANYHRRKNGIGIVKLYDGADAALRAAGLL